MSSVTVTKRITLTLLATALLGTLTAVAVAWGCALWIDLDLTISPMYRGLWPADEPQWKVMIWERAGAVQVRSCHALFAEYDWEYEHMWIPPWSRAAKPASEEPQLAADLQELWLIEEGRGWPRAPLERLE